MTNKTFSKLGKVYPYTDFLIIGIETSKGKTDSRVDALFEMIDRFCIAHHKPINGSLNEVVPMTEFDGCNVLGTILEHYHVSRNTLIICNNSLVFLGSSDLTALLESGIYEISKGSEDSEDIGIAGNEKVSTSIFIASAPPTIVGLVSKLSESKITIIDIANYGIKRIGDMCLLLDYQYAKIIPNYAELGLSTDKCDTVCACMCILFSKYYHLVFKHKLGGIALTYAGQAMRTFRRNHYDGTIIKHAQESSATLEERCYVGGRCEAKFAGWYRRKCYLLDINSLYPSIGRTHSFPRELVDSYTRPTINKISDSIESSCWFAHCRVSTQEAIYPVKINGELRWPIGEFNTYLCGPEFREALLRGDIIQIYQASEYLTGLICKDYSETMLKIRSLYKAKKDKVSEHLIKFITNGLWGYLGTQGNRWVIDEKVTSTCRYGGFIRINDANGDRGVYRVIDGKCSKLCRSYWQSNTFTPIAAYINSAARSILWRYMQLAGLSNVLYCSIDGFIVTQQGKDNIESLIGRDQYDYGKFKVVEEADSCYIHSAGRYRIGNKIAYSGLACNDDWRYRGFWNVRDDKYCIDTFEGTSATMVREMKSPKDERESLGKNDDSNGFVTSPITYSDEPLDYRIDYSRHYQPNLPFDHWSQ